MNNSWNTFIYRCWAPIYDSIFGTFFLRGRTRALVLADIQKGQKILFSGVGTGQDLPLVPAGVTIHGIDFSLQMIDKARQKKIKPGNKLFLHQMNAQQLQFDNDYFDTVFLNLILSVVPDAHAAFNEALRVLRPSGQIVIFDKFRPGAASVGLQRKILNCFTRTLGTDINRDIMDIIGANSVRTHIAEPSILNGMYRIFLLEKVVKNDD